MVKITKKLAKRLFDITFALMIIMISLPVILIITIMVLIFHGSPILFSQIRPGLNHNPFKIYKFRTMTNETDAHGKLLSDEERLTKFGKFLRSTSLDELPNLWPILKGEMSVVGPRPLLMEYLPLYSTHQAKRHLVKPGLTGWAQVNGRNAINWDEKFKYDVWYVENQSFWLDMKIVLLTTKKVFRSEGINAKGEATISKFRGNQS